MTLPTPLEEELYQTNNNIIEYVLVRKFCAAD